MIADRSANTIRRARRRLLAMAVLALAALPPAVAAQPAAAPAVADRSHDFDFEFGAWTTKLQRRLRPLTGSNEWVTYEGRSVVHPLWGGGANVGELDVAGPAGRIEGLTLRLYNPQTGQWSIRFANRRDGDLGLPMIGGFKDGRGEFYNQELFGGRAIFVRFIFSDITPRSFRLEQAFSDDGGKTWEANWISTFEKVN